MNTRRLLGAALVMAATAAVPACGGDVAKVAGRSGGTYANGSSVEEYCGLVAATSPAISHDLTAASPGVVQPVISALGDIHTLAPEEIKGDLAMMKSYLRVVVDANLTDSQIADDDLVAADLAFEEVSARVAEAVGETCGVALQ
jgi:hypothetical protein